MSATAYADPTASKRMSLHPQTRDWLTLARTPGLGPRALSHLRQRHSQPAEILRAGTARWREAGLSDAACAWLSQPDSARLDSDVDWLSQDAHHLITIDDPAYPDVLRQTPAPPPWLFAIGDTDLLNTPGFAIVGSRNPSPDGIEHARDFAAELARAGLAVISGLADGIDAAAHAGALEADAMTIAVCATGLDRVYPARNKDLARRIGDAGLLLSEFPLGTTARRGHFPRRNRIIAGLAAGTLVVEAARQSGSLITAHRAMEYGREVFALPGSVHNPLARGCHRLIREGARLVESVDDIFEEIAPQLPTTTVQNAPSDTETNVATTPDALGPEYQTLLDCVGDKPVAVDELVERSGLTADAVSSMLLILELQGLVTPGPGGVFTRNR